MKDKKILIQININEADYKILMKYGFMLEKNINVYLNEIAEELRKGEAEKNGYEA